MSDSTKLPLEDWLNLSCQKDLNEEQYQQLMESLPIDSEERKQWLHELSIHHALLESNNEASAEASANLLKSLTLKSKENHHIKRVQSKESPWPKALAAMAVGGMLLTLSQSYWYEPDLDPNGLFTSVDDEAFVTVTTLFEEEEREEALPEIEEVEFEVEVVSDMSVLEESLAMTPLKIEVAEEMVAFDDKLSDSMTFTVRTPSAVLGVRGTSFKVLPEGYSRRSGKAKSQKIISGGRDLSTMIMADPTPAQRATYHAPNENQFVLTAKDSQSTFSIDVDTASYSNVRRMLRQGKLPPIESVRIEEMINNFDYDYPQPTDGQPFSVSTELGLCPWNTEHQLLKVGLKGKVDLERPDVHLVFLLDVSGSMSSSDKLPLLKRSFKLLLNGLRPTDSVAIVAYAGHTGVVLNPTSASEKEKIIEAMDHLKSSGGTNGVGGIQLAYNLAQQNMDPKAINRVILATDGDFNVGISDRDQLQTFIEEKRKSGIELSVLGFGHGNTRDDVMELLANKGNGNYNYIDTLRSARKALVEELASNLVTIAKDVKIQMDFDPDRVKSFRLIGYENRALAHKDFADDRKDAGELGMGHTVTALYEIVPTSAETLDDTSLGQLRLRYKQPKGSQSELMETLISSKVEKENSSDYQWALATAAWGQLLRKSNHVKDYTIFDALALAKSAKGTDPLGYRAEMIQLIEASQDLLDTTFKTEKNLPMWEYRK